MRAQLIFWICAGAETLLENMVRRYQKRGHVPTKGQLIESLGLPPMRWTKSQNLDTAAEGVQGILHVLDTSLCSLVSHLQLGDLLLGPV